MRHVRCLASLAVAGALTGALTGGAHAAVVVATLPDFDGPEHVSGFPIDLGIVGTFGFALPAMAVITSATFSGTYGTATLPFTTASYEVEIEGETLVVCPPFHPGCYEFDGTPLRPFSFALGAGAFAGLLDGSADLHVVQTTDFIVRLGTPTLTIEYTAVPQPGTTALVGLALAALALVLRRRPGEPARAVTDPAVHEG